MKIPINALDAGGARSKKSTIENLVNMYAEKSMKQGISPFVIYQCSGLTEFCNTGDKPILALYTASNGIIYAITNKKLYQVNENKTFAELGTFSGDGLTDYVSVACNGFAMIFVDGVRAFTYAFDTHTLTEITSQTGMYPSNTVVFMDGYFIFNRAGTGQFFITQLYSTTTDPLDFATAESAPDDTIAIETFSNQLWLFGTKTIEIWYNSGDALFPFTRVSGGVLNRGCLSAFSVKKESSALYFVGDDGVVYAIQQNSYVPQKISTYAVEKDINGETVSYSYAFTEFGHRFYMLHLLGSEKTWCFDVTSGFWHERQSTVINETFLVPEKKRHISKCYTEGYGLKFVGSRLDGKIFYLDATTAKDDEQVMAREIVSTPIYKDNEWLKCYAFEMVAEITIKGTLSPLAILQWSDDTAFWSDGTQMAVGELGNNNLRYVARRLGRFRNRSFRITITDDTVVSILSMYIEVEE